MTLVEVTLVHRDIEPGWRLMADDVPLGKTYIVDIDRIQGMMVLHEATGRSRQLACVWVVSPGPPGYLPAMAFGMADIPKVAGAAIHPLSQDHVHIVCRLGTDLCCSYLAKSETYFCTKRTVYEVDIRKRRAAGQMKAMGDNCSGPPHFQPK